MTLIVENLDVRYGSVPAVRQASLRCEPGEIVCMIGPNGAGKSSILNAVSGALPAGVAGSVSIDGWEAVGQGAERVVRHGISLVPEGRRVFRQLSVEENLRLGLVTGRSPRGAHLQMFERFPSLERRRAAKAGVLSGGEAQQLVIATALLSRPKVLLLDEPSFGLAPLVVQQILETVIELRSEGVGLLLVEQNALAALAIADRSYLMLHGTLTERASGAASADDLIASYFGRPVDPAPPASAPAPTKGR